jgi:hypothetical protein
MQVGASGSGAVQAAWQVQQQSVPPQAAAAVAASAQADAQIATASAAMATGSTFSIMV